MTEEWGLYLKAAQGSQGRWQGSETIVRQVKVSDQEQLLQMAEHRQILRRGTRYPARPGRQSQLSFIRPSPGAPHTGPGGPQLRTGASSWEAYLTTPASTCSR